jgi:tetratricopeptide (TPR) repeat protein
MPKLPLALLLLAGCASTPAPQLDGALLPDLGEPDEPLSDSEKGAGPDASKLARALLSSTDLLDHHVISILRHHWPLTPKSIELNLLLAEAHARFVDSLDVKKKEDRLPHERHRTAGRFHAAEALQVNPESGPARYWQGVLLLYCADGEQSYGRLKEAQADFEKAEPLAGKVDDGGPARMRGRIYQETPGLLGGSNSKAIECYRRSLGIAPGRLKTRLWLAETLLADKQAEPARAELETILKAPEQVRKPTEDADVRRRAKALLEKISSK